MEKEPLPSMFGQTEMVPFVKAIIEAQENEQIIVVGIICNLQCNLMIGTAFSLMKSWTQAKIVEVTTRTQLKAKMRMKMKQEGMEPGILPSQTDLIEGCPGKEKIL